MDLTLESIPVSEALRYLGVKQTPPPDLLQQVEQACARLLPHCRPRYVWRQIAKADLPALGLDLPGEDIHTLLQDCETAVLFALTLGEEAEMLIRRAGLRSPTDALVLDAQRRCGITLSPTLIMTPRKSVTAIFGLADKPQGKRSRGCGFCSMKTNCSFRKAGITCA